MTTNQNEIMKILTEILTTVRRIETSLEDSRDDAMFEAQRRRRF